MPSVAICIPTFNQADYLAESVGSAFRQKGVAPEVWVSDDCSTDHTPAVVARLQQEYPTLKAARQEVNLGIGAHTRWIISRPQTEFIARLDSDDRLMDDYMETMVALLQAHPRAGYAHCSVIQIDENGSQTRVRRLARKTGFQSADDSLKALPDGYRVAANICIFRREALAAVDYYKTDIGYCDDWDLSVRLADAGWGNVYYDGVLAAYRVWNGAGNVRAKRMLAEVNSSVRVFDQSLAPAFARRGWDDRPLTRARCRRALSNSAVLTSPLITAPERAELTEGLRRLGGSPQLEARFVLQRMGFDFLFRGVRRSQLWVRDTVKSALHAVTARTTKPAGQ